jgi:two-component sensor histidine kinase
MSGLFWLDWSRLVVSLFNTVVLAWLGLTVLLNADRHHWGVWLMGGGLLGGAAFFVSHTAILGQDLTRNADGLNFWWRAGWLTVTLSPFVWYALVLWYAGFWSSPASALARRHRPWLALMALWTAILLGLLLIRNPVPAYSEVVHAGPDGPWVSARMPPRFLFFPALMVACTLLAADVLLWPARPGEGPDAGAPQWAARARARPWLLAAAAVLGTVGLLVAGLAVGLAAATAAGRTPRLTLPAIAWLDLGLACSIALAALLIGQAVVAYEVFTGRVLPRRAFLGHWRSVVLLAGAYAVLVAASLARSLRPIYALLLTTLVMVALYALYSRQTFVERARLIAHLRPFVQRGPPRAPAFLPFQDGASQAQSLLTALCCDLLGADRAQLTPLGVLAPLAGPPLFYPPERAGAALPVPPRLDGEVMALDPDAADGYRWAIPLWAERGLIGVLLLGPKRDGGLYSQEEIDIAQAGGERIIDLLATGQMVRRLIELQRGRVAGQQVVDLRARRGLNAVGPPARPRATPLGRAPGSGELTVQAALASLAAAHRQITDLLAGRPGHAAPPPGDLAAALRDLVQSEFSQAFSTVVWRGDALPTLDPLTAEVVLGAVREAVRNAALHGRGSRPERPLALAVEMCAGEEVVIRVQDDGVGLHSRQTGAGGSGNGLALHSTMLAVAGGTLAVESRPAGGTTVTISVPRPA